MSGASEPQHLSQALSQLIALKGLARFRGNEQLSQVWEKIAGPAIGGETTPLGIDRGVLRVAVTNSPLLNELAAFHKPSLLERIREERPDLAIRDIKFRLRGRL